MAQAARDDDSPEGRFVSRADGEAGFHPRFGGMNVARPFDFNDPE